MTETNRKDTMTTTRSEVPTGTTRTTQATSDTGMGNTVERTTTTTSPQGALRVKEFIWLVAGVVVAFLAVDFVFHLAGANNVGFAAFIFAVGSWLAAPYAGIFGNPVIDYGRGIVIWADLVGIVVYAAIGLACVKLVSIVGSRSKPAL